MNQMNCSVVIPAHNEEFVIARTLKTLLKSAAPGEFQIIVICNGCGDQTAEVVRKGFPDVCLIELPIASKTAALNAGLSIATGNRVLLLDADIELATEAARTLIDTLDRPNTLAAIGRMDVDLAGTSMWVRAFYKVWILHPYLEKGKFAAAIALSRTAVERIGSIPNVTADDTYLRRFFNREHVATANARFTVHVPREIATLIRVRSRSYRGTAQLEAHLPVSVGKRYGEILGLLRTVLLQPKVWPCLPVYCLVNIAALITARRATNSWERDLTSRTSALESS